MTERKINEIRKSYFEDKVAVEVIASRKGYCVNTIYRYLKPEYATPQEAEMKKPVSKLAPFEDIIRGWLTEDKARFYKQRHTGRRVYDRLVAECPNFKASPRATQIVYKRLLTEVYGKAARAEKPTPIAGLAEVGCSSIEFTYKSKPHKGFVLMLAFPHSNAAYMQILLGTNTECVLSALQRMFAYIGGVPQSIKFSASTKLFKHFLHDPSDIENELLLRFILFYGFNDEYFIPVCDGTNTVVTSLSKYYRRCIIPLRQEISDLAAFNEALLVSCDKLLDRKTTASKTLTSRELFFEDKAALLALPENPFVVMSWQRRKINSRGDLVLDGKHCYYLPQTLINRSVYVCLTEDKVYIRNLDNEPVYEFKRLYSDAPENVQDVTDLLRVLRSRPRALLYSTVKSALSAPVVEFLRENRAALSDYTSALYELTKTADFDSAVKIIEIAVSQNLKKEADILALYQGGNE
jgi:transposase